MREVRARFRWLRKQVYELLVREDALGLRTRRLTLHTRWAAQSSPEQLEAFRRWLGRQIDVVTGTADDTWLARYIEEAYQRGAKRSQATVLARRFPGYEGGQEEFLRSAFGRPAAEERVRLLLMRAYTDLQGVTQSMAPQLARALADGMIAGLGPREIARNISAQISKIERTRALVIARTEIIRAHAEGQLDSLEMMGVEEVGVMVEWATAGDDRVCPLCLPQEGQVYKIDQARGMIPLHPNCRCAWIPVVNRPKRRRRR